MAPDITLLILAAGASRRMRGGDKMLEQVDGVPQLRRIALAARATAAPVRVCLPPDRPARWEAVADLGLRCIAVPDADQGLSASIRAGVTDLPAGQGVMLVLADLPELTAADLSAMLQAAQAAPEAIWRATSADGDAGHPVILPARLVPDLARLTGDSGARDLLRKHAAELRFLALPGAHAITDLDTPEDWVAWRAAHPGR